MNAKGTAMRLIDSAVPNPAQDSRRARTNPVDAALGSPWPASARGSAASGDLSVGGVDVARLVARHGTPLYLLDENEIRSRARRYRAALPQARIFYAAKAFLCRQVAAWVSAEGLGLDVCSLGELQVALAAGVPAASMVLHGNAKSPQELRAAVTAGVGAIVIDDLAEITRLAALVGARGAGRC
jgi:diaminopimelate decarboxylase